MTSLKSSFNQRKVWENYRASTVFPYFPKTYQSIVFQDYWSWKSNILDKYVVISIRNENGKLVHQEKIHKIFEHNNYSIPPSLCEGGMIEIEIISNTNIKFPFPAVMMFVYSIDNTWVSCVHSGGRILNDNEEFSPNCSVESNFLCRLDNEFTPFFHLFNGKNHLCLDDSNVNISRVHICSESDNTVLHSVPFLPPSLPYESKLYTLSELLDIDNTSVDSFPPFYLRINALSNGTFPRLICGNIHKGTGFPFVTHSFKCYDTNKSGDIQKSTNNNGVTMFFPICCVSPLDLKIRSYPTNEPMLVATKQQYQTSDCISDSSFLTGSDGAAVQVFDSDGVNSIVRTHGSAPSRLNCSLNYSLSNSLHPTDIATGFKCTDYPPKHSHWGHAIISDQFDTILFIRWIELPSNQSVDTKINLPIHIFNDLNLPKGIIKMIISSNNVGYFHIVIIYNRCQHIGW